MRSRSVLPAPGDSRLLVICPPQSRLLRARPATYVDWLGVERQLRIVEPQMGPKSTPLGRARPAVNDCYLTNALPWPDARWRAGGLADIGDRARVRRGCARSVALAALGL